MFSSVDVDQVMWLKERKGRCLTNQIPLHVGFSKVKLFAFHFPLWFAFSVFSWRINLFRNWVCDPKQEVYKRRNSLYNNFVKTEMQRNGATRPSISIRR
jgi:hypothetical protein